MEPDVFGVRAIIVKSFARIHETNLKKQGSTAAGIFPNKADYDKVREDDTIDIIGLTAFTQGEALSMMLHHHEMRSTDSVTLNHTYNESQIEWFKAGSALKLNKKAIPGEKSTPFWRMLL